MYLHRIPLSKGDCYLTGQHWTLTQYFPVSISVVFTERRQYIKVRVNGNKCISLPNKNTKNKLHDLYSFISTEI